MSGVMGWVYVDLRTDTQEACVQMRLDSVLEVSSALLRRFDSQHS
jgi:hypothetical protein